MKVIVLLLLVQVIYSYKTKQYQRTNVSEFNIGPVFSASSKISCGVACLANNSCEGFDFDGFYCSILSEILVDSDGFEQVWIDPEILGKIKTKHDFSKIQFFSLRGSRGRRLCRLC